ncbi:MAG: chromate transporter [Clostridiales bacterium]|nr:chromate transporter [Clostridiales bacterium]
MKTKDCLKLFTSFFKIGLFTFGGGYAMLPMIQREITEKHGWATEEEVLDYYAIGQTTPGIIAINTATFIGYKKSGIAGAISATLGMVGPSLIIITALSSLIIAYRDNEYVTKALRGIQGAVVALVAVSIVKMGKKALTSILTYVLGIVGFALLFILKLPTYAIVLGTITLSLLYIFISKRKRL